MISENIRVFWQPHWTSCIRVKDYLKQRGIEYESVNIVEDGMEDLQKLGAKSVPVVSRGDKFVFAQVIRDVVEFLELDEDSSPELNPEELAERFQGILWISVSLVGLFPNNALVNQLPNRPR